MTRPQTPQSPLATLFGLPGGTPAPALAALRGVAGLAMMFHGWNKIQNPFGWMGPDSGFPGILQALAALSEFGGGLAWILGLLTPLASFGILCTMIVAAARHILKGDPFVGRPSYELAMLYLVIAALLLVSGPGRWSLDALLFGRRREPGTVRS